MLKHNLAVCLREVSLLMAGISAIVSLPIHAGDADPYRRVGGGVAPVEIPQSGPALPRDAASLDRLYPRVTERSGPEHITWNLGPATGEPGKNHFITALVGTPGTYGGWECNQGTNPGTGSNGNPSTQVYVGEYPLFGNPRYTCNGYIRWELGSALPATAQITSLQLNPLNVYFFNNGPRTQDIHLVDVNNIPSLPYAGGFNLAIYNDFNAMFGGRDEYGLTNASATGSLTVNLNHQAVQDANDRLRASPYGYFAVGFYSSAQTPGNYLQLSSSASTMTVGYTDYVPNQVVINFVASRATATQDEVDLYNFGENIAIGGWTIHSVNNSGQSQDFTLPAFTLPRHSRVRVRATVGSNTADTIFTGSALWNWSGANLQIFLQRADGSTADYVCRGAPPAPPAGTGWQGACVASGALANNYGLARNRDSDTDGAGDWTPGLLLFPPNPGVLMTGQTGSRRRSDVFFNQIDIYPGDNWLEILNNGPDTNLAGWSVRIYSRTTGTLDGTYTFPDNPLLSGELVWLKQLNNWPSQTNFRRNLGFPVTWNTAPYSGEAILYDEAGRARDYLVFGKPLLTHTPPEIPWIGPNITVGAAFTEDWTRDTDLNLNGGGNWVSGAVGNFGQLSANQRGPLRVQDEIGSSAGVQVLNVSGASGAGDVITVTQQVGLEAFSVEAAPIDAPRTGALVVKKSGAAGIFFTRAVTVSGPGVSQPHSGLITPPLVLDPGTYAVMLYLDGAWYDNERAGSTERLSFGTVGGVTFEAGAIPTTAFAVNTAGSAAHAHMSVIHPAMIGAGPGNGEVSVPYSFTYSSTGGYGASRTWSVIAGGLPPGLVMSAAGAITGTPTTAGIFSYTVQVVDGAGLTRTRAENLTISTYIAITTVTLPAGAVAAFYTFNIASSGGVGAFTWSVDSGLLPNGVALTGNWLNGTPQVGGTFNFVIRVTDSLGATDTQALSIVVSQPLMILNTGLPVGVISVAYPSFSLVAAGGTIPYSFSIAAGIMPPGLSLASNGAISGTPTTVGSYPVTFRVTDAALPTAGTATRALTFTISNPPSVPAWKARGLDGGNLAVIAVSPNNEADNTVYVAGQAGEIFATHDQGLSWSSTLVKPDQAGPSIVSLALSPTFNYNSLPADPVENKTIFAANRFIGVYRSTDLGLSFSAANTGLPAGPQGPDVYSIVLHPNYAANQTLWANQYKNSTQDIYRSTDSGGSWTMVGSVARGANVGGSYELAVSPNVAADHTLILLSYDGKVHRSVDDGVNWNAVYTTSVYGDAISEVVFSPEFAVDHTIIGKADNGLWRSRDAGATFVKLTPAAYTGVATRDSLAALKRAGTTPRWYVLKNSTGPGSILYSDDHFSTHVPAYSGGLKSQQWGSVGVSRELSGGGANLFVASDLPNGGVTLSADDGFSFETRDKGVAAFHYLSLSGNGDTLAATNLAKWFKSGDAGVNWVNLPSPNVYPYSSAFSPDYPNDHVHFIGGFGLIMRTSDGGQTFPFATISNPGRVHGFAFFPGFSGGSGRVWVNTDATGIRESNDGGLTFSASPVVPSAPCTLGATSNIWAIKISPNYASDGTIFISGSDNTFGNSRSCKTTDSGASWTVLLNGASQIGGSLELSPTYHDDGTNGTHEKTLFLSNRSPANLLRSTDGGATWNTVAPGYSVKSYSGIVVSPVFDQDGTVFVFTTSINAGVTTLLRSADAGATFAPLGAADLLKTRPVEGVYLPPSFDGRNSSNSPAVVATTGSGIWRSEDGGRTFGSVTGYTLINDIVNDIVRVPGGAGLTGAQAQPGFIGPRLPAAVAAGTLLAATTGQGVFQSDDGGLTFTPISAGLPANANTRAVLAPSAAATAPVTAVANAGSAGIYRYNGSTWALAGGAPTGNFTRFLEFPQPVSGSYLYATRSDGRSVRSGDNGATWLAQDAAQSNLVYADYNATTLPTVAGRPPPGKVSANSPDGVTGTNAALWSVSQAAGARYSLNSGSTWLAATGSGDYALPAASGYTTVKALGLNAGLREVLVGHSTLGLYKSEDGGDKWRNMTGAGSGLESTSKNAGAMITTVTPSGTTDILLGLVGSTTGGVYLSGDGGEHWMQINQGFDPNNLNITTLAKTSCSGCPVQYYSGTYGSGVYTRTIPVNPEPAITGWCFTGAACACAAAAGSGPQQGGQAFKLCGSNFAALATVEFDGIPATGCTITVPSTISCTATPAHAAGLVSVRVRNTDTRDGYISPDVYTYNAGAPRIANLRVVKSGADALLTWSCGTCGTVTAGVTRSQNAPFNLNVESYIGGITGSWTNTGALATGSNATYYWSVE